MSPTKQIIKKKITTWPELGINYWGIHKNATTTLSDYFVQLVGDNPLYKEWLPAKDDAWKRKTAAAKRSISSFTALSNGLVNFCLVRDPVDRFFSIYKMWKYPKDLIQERSATKAKFDSTDSPNDFAEKILAEFSRGIKKSGNKHLWKQVWYLPSDITKIDQIVNLENLQKDWPFDFPYPDYKVNKTTKIQNLSVDKEIIYQAYNEDYSAFGYLP